MVLASLALSLSQPGWVRLASPVLAIVLCLASILWTGPQARAEERERIVSVTCSRGTAHVTGQGRDRHGRTQVRVTCAGN